MKKQPIRVKCSPPEINSKINVNPTPVNVNPTPVTIDPSLSIGPFKRVCSRTNTGTFENRESIPILGTVSQSDIEVTGLKGVITKVTVILFNINYLFSSNEIDTLLVHPNGLANTIVMSDAGGNFPLANTTLIFDDDAPSLLPVNAQIVSGTFKPTNYDIIENFPPPAPSPTSNVVALSNFNGLTPNGTWRLFVTRDVSATTGTIDGWALNITTTETEECIYTPL